MLFGILGPLVVCDAGETISVSPPRQRVLLAALVVHAGRPVSLDALAEVVWDGAPPDGAAATLRAYVMRLRRALGPGPGGRVVTHHPGYMAQVTADETDLLRFTRLSRDGAAAVRAGSWAPAYDTLTEALALWRGEPLADIPSQILRDQVDGLEEQRLQVIEWRVDAGLQLGHHRELAAELQLLTTKYPLRERFHAQLMLALARCGRQGEALETYRKLREVLVAELGVEPGADLRRVHQMVLSGGSGQEIRLNAAGDTLIPRQLPPVVPHFIGRKAELSMLTSLLGEPARPAGAVVVSAIGGTAGVGKTALAVHWAHQVVDTYPDGQLYVNLRGHDPGKPMTATDALAGFLRALGVRGQEIPPDEAERAAHYRSLLAGRRMLVILDNAVSAEQVRPLLPGTPAATVLVTSRDTLAGLIARDGATLFGLDLLPHEDAVGLLRVLIGARADADPGNTAALAAQCCRLPLALRIAAYLAVSRATIPLAALVTELADQQRRLELLDADGDPRTGVRAVFSWSYRNLDPAAARVFRLAGLHPGADLDSFAVAALTGDSPEQAQRSLGVLARAQLLQEAGPGRYEMHDLMRAYARELVTTEESADDRQDALTRLFDYYLATVAGCMDTLFPAESSLRPYVGAPDTPIPPVADPAVARSWLDNHRASLVAVVAHAVDHDLSSHIVRMADLLFRYLDSGGYRSEAIELYVCTGRAAKRNGDHTAEAAALTNIGIARWQEGSYQEAADQLRQALELYHATDDQKGTARALNALGLLSLQQGSYQEAADQLRQALELYRAIGGGFGEHYALGNLGIIEMRQGRYRQASAYLGQALAFFRETGDRTGEAYMLGNLGVLELRRGSYPEAAGHLGEALRLCRATGDRTGEAHTLTRLGLVDLRQGRSQQAAERHQQALAFFRKAGDRSGQIEALNGLGEAFLAIRQPGDAQAQHALALGLARENGEKPEQARAHDGLARAYHAHGDRDRARHHWQAALSIYTDLRLPETEHVRRLSGSLPAE